MKINGAHHTSSNNSRGINSGASKPADLKPRTAEQAPKTTEQTPKVPKTEDTSKTDDKSKDGTTISDQEKDDKKDGKCEKCEDLKGLLDALKDMFGDKDDDKKTEEAGKASGGGEQSPSQGGGQGGGGCNKAGGAAPTDQAPPTDPISKLEDAVKKVERAQGTDKKKAVTELKELYKTTKESGVEIPEKLQARIDKALKGGHEPRAKPTAETKQAA